MRSGRGNVAGISAVVGALFALGLLGWGLWSLLGVLRPAGPAPQPQAGPAPVAGVAPRPGRARSTSPPSEIAVPSAVPEGHPFENTYVRGRVFDRESGEGVEGALVVIRATFGEPHLGPPGGDGAARYRTERGGNFALRGVPDGSFDLEVTAEGFLPGKAGFRRFSTVEDDEGFEIPLDAAGTVSGRVLDEAGKGVVGAQVYAAPERARYLDGDSTTGRSGEGGAFELGPVGVGPLRVYAFHPDFGSSSAEVEAVPDTRRYVEVSLRRGKRVVGRVAGPLGALAGVRVEPGVLHDDSGGVSLTAGAQPIAATTDQRGAYSLVLGLGATRLDFSLSGHRRASRMLVVRSDDPEPIRVDVELKEGATLAGRILGADSRPARRAVVVVTAGAGGLVQAESDDEGRFRVEGLPAQGPYRVAIRHHLHPPFEAAEAEVGEGREYRLPAPARLRGRIVDAVSGAPIREYEYLLSGPVRARNSAVSASGAIELDQLPPGEYTLVVRAEGYQAAQLDGLLVGVGDERDGLVVRLRPGATVAGFVRGAAPEAEVLVQVMSANEGDELFVGGALAGEDGSFMVDGLPGGRLRVVARSAGRQGELAEVFVEEGGVRAGLELVLEGPR